MKDVPVCTRVMVARIVVGDGRVEDREGGMGNAVVEGGRPCMVTDVRCEDCVGLCCVVVRLYGCGGGTVQREVGCMGLVNGWCVPAVCISCRPSHPVGVRSDLCSLY